MLPPLRTVLIKRHANAEHVLLLWVCLRAWGGGGEMVRFNSRINKLLESFRYFPLEVYIKSVSCDLVSGSCCLLHPEFLSSHLSASISGPASLDLFLLNN